MGKVAIEINELEYLLDRDAWLDNLETRGVIRRNDEHYYEQKKDGRYWLDYIEKHYSRV